MMRLRGSLLLLLAVTMGMVLSAVFSPRALAGKPPSPPPGPRIDFEVTWLPSLGGTTMAEDINSAGTIVGISDDLAGVQRGFVYTDAIGLKQLDT